MEFKADFESKDGLIYLNSGSLSRTPTQVIQAIQNYRQEFEANPTQSLFSAWGRIWKVQSKLAAFLGVKPDQLFLRHNVTQAMNTFLMGIPLPSDGEILATDLEYGAVLNICRLRAETSGLTLRALNLPTDSKSLSRLTREDYASIVIGALKPHTRMVMLSHVMTGTGLVLPIDLIAKETHKRGIILAVDGAHGTGAIDFKIGQIPGLDFYGGNLHKWTMGPKGTGFGWVSPEHHTSLRTFDGGWTTFETPTNFSEFGEFGEKGPSSARFATRFLSASTYDFSGTLGISDVIDYWNEKGAHSIFEKRRGLRKLALQRMREKLDWPLMSPEPDLLQGPLLTWDLPPHLKAQGGTLMWKLLQEHGLQVAIPMVQGEYRLRLSPSVYNSEQDIERAVEILQKH